MNTSKENAYNKYDYHIRLFGSPSASRHRSVNILCAGASSEH
jgi:hypothetical protein